ncbi:MAG TPA: radical SAM protein [Candidatus Caldiarchaeum subterraneum]|uniref:Radical SAM protein n=1 Tax=Caldiarchaeum subterraneum TaxID=311458 RepID=A0A832ZWM7_CALS0|nr:radical SAM protein [Candidatus Caldarchaeum subterraneum]
MAGYRWWSNEVPEHVSKPCKTLLHKFSEAGGEDDEGYTINPYKGCAHRCVYCYATYEWSPDFYDVVIAKSNAHEVLLHDILKEGRRNVTNVLISSATDCYQPAEGKYKLTRKCIEILQRLEIPYTIITKSSTVLRDLDLHRRYKERCSIIWSLTTVDENLKRIIEPNASPARSILKAVRVFSSHGVRVGINLDPIIPGLNDGEEQLRETVEKAVDAGARFVGSAVLRLRSDIWIRLRRLLESEGMYKALRKIEEVYFRYPIKMGYYYLAHPRYVSEKQSYVEMLVKRCGGSYGLAQEDTQHEPCYVKASQLSSNQRRLTLYV